MNNLSGLRIGFIAGTLGRGGAERQLFYNLAALQQAGAQLWVYSLTKGEYWHSRIEQLGIPVTWIGQSDSRPRRLVTLLRLLRRQPVDFLQSQHFFTNLYAVVCARLTGCRDIGAIRNDATSEVSGLGWLAGTASLRWPRKLAANSTRAIHNAVSLGRASRFIFFLPNVVDTRFFIPPDQPASSPLHVLAAGRLVRQKRFDRLVRVVRRLPHHLLTRIQVSLIGDGPEREQLQQMILAEGLNDVIQMLPARDDLLSAYQSAHLLMLTSDHEGTPNVILEAMSCGLPILATHTGGIPEIVESDASGLLFDPQDETGLARGLQVLCEDETLRVRMGTHARAYVCANHSLERLPARLQELYQA